MQRRQFLAASTATVAATGLFHRSGASAMMANGDEPKASLPGESAFDDSSDILAGPAKGPWRRLMLDAAAVESSEGLTRVFHQAKKRAQPVIVADRPWEGTSAITGPFKKSESKRHAEVQAPSSIRRLVS